jgi:hypothetical protein
VHQRDIEHQYIRCENPEGSAFGVSVNKNEHEYEKDKEEMKVITLLSCNALAKY